MKTPYIVIGIVALLVIITGAFVVQSSARPSTAANTPPPSIAVGEPNPSAGDPSNGTVLPGRPGGQMETLPLSRAKALVREESGQGEAILLSAESVDWPDSCLGVAKPDEMCAQVVTPGFTYKIQSGGKIYTMHTNADGSSVREDGSAVTTTNIPPKQVPQNY